MSDFEAAARLLKRYAAQHRHEAKYVGRIAADRMIGEAKAIDKAAERLLMEHNEKKG